MAVNGTDEYNFSSTGLAFNSNNITGLGTNLTATAGLTIATGTASNLTINSGTTGTLAIGDDASAETVNVGTGAAAKTVVLGSTNTTSGTTINSGSGGITMVANGTTISNAELILLDGKTGTLIDDTDLTSGDGAGGTSSGSGMEAGTGGIGLLQGCSANQILKWNDGTSVWACAADEQGSGGAPDTATFTDANPAAWNGDNNTVELFNDATKPNIVTDSASSTVLVSLHIEGSTSNTANDTFLGARLVYTTDGSGPSCSGSSQVGNDMISSYAITTSYNFSDINGTFLHTPGVAGTIKYTVCSSSAGGPTQTDTAPSIDVTLVELGADLAENYYTSDDSIEPGDVVSIEEILPAGIKKSDRAYDSKAIGVVSTAPGITLDDAIGLGVGRAVPVALAGRIPVKVSTENGRVKAGDYLTSSSVPGVAMKATKSGIIIGQALQDFNYQDGETGLVITFVKNGYFDGEKLLADTGEPLNGITLLQKMLADKAQTNPASNTSVIVTDQIAAGLEIITPKITTETAALDKIEAATGLDINMNLTDSGVFKINNALTGENGIIFDNAGNATFQGTVTADSIAANKILGLEIFTNQISNVDESVSSLSLKLENLAKKTEEIIDLSSLGIAEKKGGLVIAKKTTFQKETVFEQLATLLGNAIFRGEVSFEKVPTFSSDTAGFAVIKDGAKSVKVIFDEEYANAPVVNASLSLGSYDDEEVRQAAEELLLVSDVKYIITNVTTKDFEIKIGQKALSDIRFSWQALAVKGSKTSYSRDIKKDTTEDSADTLGDTSSIFSEPVNTPEEEISSQLSDPLIVEPTVDPAPLVLPAETDTSSKNVPDEAIPVPVQTSQTETVTEDTL